MALLRSWPMRRPPARAKHTVVAPHAFIGRQIGVRTSAPMRRPPSGVGLDLVQAEAIHIDECVGVSIWSFIKSSRLVPPAMNLAPGMARHRGRRLRGRSSRVRKVKAFMRYLPATSVIASAMLE